MLAEVWREQQFEYKLKGICWLQIETALCILERQES